jgi:hypothetical protein
MRQQIRLLIALIVMTTLVAVALPASAEHRDRERTRNLHPMGHIEEPRNLLTPGGDNLKIHTDIAFWGDYAFQGTWRGGFNIRDISAPGRPRQVAEVTDCDGPQGDVVVWQHILVRTWDQPAGSAFALPAPFDVFGAGNECGGQTYPDGWEGVHIFDISDVHNPVLVGDVQTRCGSHTASGVPDPANNRLLVYSSGSSLLCEGFDLIEIPLDNPAGAFLVREVAGEMMCHDIGVIMGDVMKAACAGHHGLQVYDISTLDDPAFLYMVDVNDVFGYAPGDPGFISIGHSAVFTWDGEVIVFGHEPGGGVQARCQEGQPETDRSAMFFRAEDGEFLGLWTLPRPQGPDENCTIHNYNMVPLPSGRYVMVGGHYQAGTWVVDFTDPANARTVAWSDPAAKPVPDTPLGQLFGNGLCGAWSSYWYNGFIYETNICEGLNVFRLSGMETAGAIRLGHLNPQTQEFSLP